MTNLNSKSEYALFYENLGAPDPDVTRKLQDYHLPGQEDQFITTLLDKDEELLCVEDRANFAHKVQRANESLQRMSKAYIKEGGRMVNSAFEIVVGNPQYPDTCFRYRVSRAWYKPKDQELAIEIWGNIEYEKQEGEHGTIFAGELSDSQIAGMEHPGIEVRGRTGRTIFHQRPPMSMTSLLSDLSILKVGKDQKIWVVEKKEADK